MNTNRKADLQRKLALAPVPTPPAGLAERIKREIPKQLRIDTDAERKRFAQSIGFSIRVAASVLILTLSAYAMLHLISRMDEQKPAAIERAAPMARRPASTPAPQSAATEIVPSIPEPAKLQTHQDKPQSNVAEKKQEEQPSAAGGFIAPLQETQNITVSASAPAVAPQVESKAMASFADRERSTAKDLDDRTVAQLRVDHEVTIAPSGKTILRVSIENATKDAKVEVAGAKLIAASLYEIDAATATIRVHYRQDGAEKTLEQIVKRDDARPWTEASKTMRDAMQRLESKGPPP